MDRSLVAAVALVTAGVANLPAVYVLVALPDDAAYAPLIVVAAGLSMAAAFVGGLALEGRHYGLARVMGLVLVLQAPAFISLGSTLSARLPWEMHPAAATPWFFLSALLGLIALVSLHGVTENRPPSATSSRGREGRVEEPRP